MNSRLLLLFVMLVSVGFVAAQSISNMSFVPLAPPGGTFNITGIVLNSSNGTVSGANVTIVLSNSSNSSISTVSNTTNSTGNFLIFGTAPSGEGFYNITLTTNASTPTYVFPIYVTPVRRAVITSNATSFSIGTPFNITINLTNSSGGAVGNRVPNVQVFSGATFTLVPSWTLTNLSNATASNGIINYTVTPSNNSGAYYIVVEYGAGAFYVSFQSNIQLVLTTESAGVATTTYRPGDNVTLRVRLRHVNGTAFSNQTVNTTISFPNGTSVTVTNFTESSTGQYEANYTLPSSQGTYSVSATSNVSGNVVQGNSQISVTILAASLTTTNQDQGRFVDLAELGFRGAQPGGNVTLLFFLTNLSSGQRLSHSTTPSDSSVVNCSAVNITSVLRLNNNTEYGPSVIGTLVQGNITYLGSRVCTLQVTMPSETGFFRVRAAVPHGGSSYSADYNFQTQRYILRATPVTAGSESSSSFMMLFRPGRNLTLVFEAYNISNGGAALVSTMISNINVSSIQSFITGVSITNGTSGFNSNVSTTDNRVMITLPTSFTEFLMITSRAQVAGEEVITTTPIIAKNIFGFFSPSAQGFFGTSGDPGSPGGGFHAGGPSEGPGGPEFFSETRCQANGLVGFRGTLRFADNQQGVANANVQNITRVMLESTGREVTSCFSVNSSTASDANGSINMNLSFSNASSCSYNGRYFMFVNVSYAEGGTQYTELIPSFFNCRSLRAQIRVTPVSASSNQFFQVSRTGCMQVNVSSIALTNGSNFSNGNLTFPQVMVMSWGQGPGGDRPNVLTSTAVFNVNSSAGTGAVICPQNFTDSNGATASSWGSGQGFVRVVPQICTNISTTRICQDFENGISLGSSLEIYTPWGQDASLDGESPPFNQPFTGNLGSNVSIRVAIVGNISNVSAANISNVTVRLRRFGPFAPSTIGSVGSGVSLTFLANKSRQWDNKTYRIYAINFTIPTTATKGPTGVEMEITDRDNERGNVFHMLVLGNLQLYVPLFNGDMRLGTGRSFVTNDTLDPMLGNQNMLQVFGWNMSFINRTVINSSVFNMSRAVCINNVSTSFQDSFGGYVPIRSVGMNSPTDPSFFNQSAFMVIDVDNDSTYDTVIMRNKSSVNSANNLSAHTVLNLTNRSLGGNYTLLAVNDCEFFRLTYSGPVESSSMLNMQRDLGEYNTNTNITVPFLFKRGTESGNSSTANITQIYRRSGSDFGIGTRSTNYSVTAANTDANGLALLTLNITQTGVYTLYWRVNGSFNDSSAPGGMESGPGGPSTDPTITIRNFRVFTSMLGLDRWRRAQEVTSDMLVNLTNETSGSLDLFNLTNASLFRANFNSTVNISFNTTSGIVAITYPQSMGGPSMSQNASCDGFCYLNSTFRFVGLPIGDQIELRVMKRLNTTGSVATNILGFGIRRDPSTGGASRFGELNSSTLNVTALVCANSYTLPSRPLVGANISNISAIVFPRDQPSTTVGLAMYDPYNGTQMTTVLTGPTGCALVRFGPSNLAGGVWPDTRFSPPVRVYFTVNNTGQVEQTDGRDAAFDIFVRPQ